MKSKTTLILQHLLDCGVLEPNDAEEVLPIFSKDVASTVAVTIVTSFTENGSIPELNSQFTIDWTMQSVAYCLSLSTLFHTSLVNSMTIFRHWLVNPNFFKDNKVWNTYAQRIFVYLSQILQNRQVDSDQSIRNDLILKLFEDLKNYQSNLHDRFDDETWNILIRILIGSADFLLKTEKSFIYTLDCTNKTLLTNCFRLLFEIIINSNLTSKTIWSVFFKFCNEWSSNETFLKSWVLQLQIIFKTLLENLYNEKERNNAEYQKKLRLTGFHLHQFIYCINFQTVVSNSKLFSILSDLIQILANIMTNFVNTQSNGLYKPLTPSSVFFKLFGHWCFTPYSDSLLSCQAVLYKVLMNIAGDWEIDSEWSKVLLSTLMSVLKKDNTQLKQTVMRNGHYVLKQFISNDIIEKFHIAIDSYSPSEPACMDFWFSYATLLSEVSERKEIQKKTIDEFLKKSKNQKAKLTVLTIVLRQRSSDFVSIVKSIAEESQNSIRKSGNNSNMNTNMNATSDVNYSSVDFMIMICLLIASAPPFIKIEKIDVLIQTLLDFISSINIQPQNQIQKYNYLINSFVIMLASLARWSNCVFESNFASKLIKFITYLNNELKVDINDVSQFICGRPVDRSIQKVDVSKNLVSFMSGNKSILTIYGDNDEREEKFVLHVRERRGFFTWEINDVVDQRSYSPQKVEGELDPPIPIQYNIINSNYESSYHEITDVEEQIEKSKTLDENYTKPSNHDQKSYISIYSEKYKLRHKAIDFLIQTQLSSNIRKISDNVNDVLSNFDKIDVVPILRIPLFYTNSSGFTNSQEQSPLFKRFIALLGPLNEKENIPESKLGLIDVLYSQKFENDGFIGIVFNECSLSFNYEHSSIPKCKLLFFVKPYNPSFYSIRCICSDSSFYCDIYEERMINTENLASAISMAIFQFTALTNPSFIFSKDRERDEFLKNIQTEKVSSLDIINGYTLDEFRK